MQYMLSQLAHGSGREWSCDFVLLRMNVPLMSINCYGILRLFWDVPENCFSYVLLKLSYSLDLNEVCFFPLKCYSGEK